VNESGFDLEVSKNEKLEGQKKKQLVIRTLQISFEEAKTVKTIVKF
jgi:ribosome maturation factor RimP